MRISLRTTDVLIAVVLVMSAVGCGDEPADLGKDTDATLDTQEDVADVATDDTAPDTAPDTTPDTLSDAAPDVALDSDDDLSADLIGDAATDIGEDVDVAQPDSSDVADLDDGGTDAVVEVDADCGGKVNCPCTSDFQCMSGVCLMRRSGQPTCALPCVSACPSGYVCESQAKLCIEKDLALCDPCSKNSDCTVANAANRCVAWGGAGSFCGLACVETGDCPADFECAEVQDAAGQTVKQCRPALGASCDCSGRAMGLGLATGCSLESTPCPGDRGCLAKGQPGAPEAGGLSACDAPAAVTEVCDGADNDCDGNTDGTGLCDDSEPCTTDSCGLKGCEHVAASDGAACDDGNACTALGACAAGQCKAGAPVVCDDKNGCTDDSCDKTKGCVHLAADATCTDGDACTTDETCVGGSCAGAKPVGCDDGNACTGDSCDKTKGCVYQAIDAACTDGSVCTLGDKCVVGVCTTSGVLKCDDDNPCTDDSCHQVQGCANAVNAAPCSDGDACTTGEACSQGKCGEGVTLDCDDGKVCTSDACDKAKGCVYLDLDVPCTDGDACTVGDACKDGECVVDGPLPCDDEDPCTDDTCDKGTGCVNLANEATCTDGNACTDGDSCVKGACVTGEVLDCDDKEACTEDSCNPEVGCVHTALTGDCTDNDVCTEGDTCSEGKCVSSTSIACDDGNVCTDDTCDPVAGCQNTPNQAECTDDNACTAGDACKDGNCEPGLESACNDNNVCTDDSCDPTNGCTNDPNGAPCDDGDACTWNDTCNDSACQDTIPVDCEDNNICTDDSCDKSSGCKNIGNSEPCTDGNDCTQDDACKDGACEPGAMNPCDDGNSCTTDVCDPVDSCVSTANNDPCDDGDACTQNDACGDGSCQSGPATNCDDNNVCTDDSCDPAVGCANDMNSVPCDDGNACTWNDTCNAGACDDTFPVDCDDGLSCTIDSCEPAIGCVHTELACDSGISCFEATGKCEAKVLISEFAAFSGSSGAAAGDEFVELYNPGDTVASLKGLKVEYGSSTGTTWSSKNGAAGFAAGVTIPAHGYFLITSTNSYSGTVAADFKATGDLGLGGTAGVLQLVVGTTVMDFVGYGTGTTRVEGTGPAPVHTVSGNGSVERKAVASSTADTMAAGGVDALRGNGRDSGDNKTDFIIRTARDPQNTKGGTEKP